MKRPHSPSAALAPLKKHRKNTSLKFNKIASFENAAAVDENPPLKKLEALMAAHSPGDSGDAVVYWMRMQDMRIQDNRALSAASRKAKSLGIPLLSVFAISPQDYRAHDHGPRRIDFMLRNLAVIKDDLSKLDIPLFVFSHSPRKNLPEKILEIVQGWGVKHLYGNIEYEVDELRRDIRIATLAKERGIYAGFIHDRPVVSPGLLKTKQGKDYAVYSPWYKSWLDALNKNISWLDKVDSPSGNPPEIRSDEKYKSLFESQVPESVEGFECVDREQMIKLWPAGTEAACEFLDNFFNQKAMLITAAAPLEVSQGTSSQTRAKKYGEGRDRADMTTASKISPYLASGVISARQCIRKAMERTKAKTVDGNKATGVGTWISEIAWRDFYAHVLCAFPRVSMGRPYLEKYANVKWEVNEEHLKAWQEGRTGVPVVDAGMRQLNSQGWMHNRARMIVASYLTKDLMLDWRLGEKYFMEKLIDGDLSSNNGGWQWSASTGADPQPYFRIFNPYSQSQKVDPTGDYIRHFVPELKNIKGKLVYNPFEAISPAEFKKLGYPQPLVDHKTVRERALRRYKNPGEI